MRTATAIRLSVPSFAEILIGIFGLLYPNALALLPPLMLVAFVCLIVAIGIASYQYEQTTRNAWTWLCLALPHKCLRSCPCQLSPLTELSMCDNACYQQSNVNSDCAPFVRQFRRAHAFRHL